MAYTDRFQLIEDYLGHLDPMMGSIADPFIQSRYLGFITISAVTSYELAIKDIFYAFADKKHVVLGEFARARFDRLNGRIKLHDLRNEHIRMFGEKYTLKFNKVLKAKEKECLRAGKGNPGAAYGNIISWRHNFVHGGTAPTTTNYEEIKTQYELGKSVIDCLNKAMTR